MSCMSTFYSTVLYLSIVYGYSVFCTCLSEAISDTVGTVLGTARTYCTSNRTTRGLASKFEYHGSGVGRTCMKDGCARFLAAKQS